MKIVDGNVLLYAINPETDPADKVPRWWEQAMAGDESIGLSWIVLSGFLRIATNPRIYPRPMTVDQALDEVEGLAICRGRHDRVGKARPLAHTSRHARRNGNRRQSDHGCPLGCSRSNPRRHAGFLRQRLRPICGPALGEPPARPVGATLVVARAAGDLRLRSIATRMRSILDTRPKGAPGRDRPVPYGALFPARRRSGVGPLDRRLYQFDTDRVGPLHERDAPFCIAGFHEELRTFALKVGNRRLKIVHRDADVVEA